MIEASLLLEEKLLITQHWPDYLLIEHSDPHEELYELHKQTLFINTPSLLDLLGLLGLHPVLDLHSPITFLLTDFWLTLSLPLSLQADWVIFTSLGQLEKQWWADYDDIIMMWWYCYVILCDVVMTYRIRLPDWRSYLPDNCVWYLRVFETEQHRCSNAWNDVQ